MFPVILDPGPITISNVYGFTATLALVFVVATLFTASELKRRGHDGGQAWKFVAGGMVGGLAGIGLWSALNNWDEFLAHPLRVLFSLNLDPITVHITIYSFGAMLALAFLAATHVTAKELGRRGYDSELASKLVIWAAVGGLIGARLWSIWDDWDEFLLSPLQVILSGSGLVFYGGLAGGTIAVTMAMRRYGLPWLTTVDCIAPGLPLAHAIGRIGCELAGDGDWGQPSTLPWAHAYPNAIIGWQEWVHASGYPHDVRVHPTPIYEFLMYLSIFGILWSIRKRPMAPGSLLWLYFILGGIARFAVEFVRINDPVLLGLTEAQCFSLFLIAVGAWRLAVGASATPATTPAAARPEPAPAAKS